MASSEKMKAIYSSILAIDRIYEEWARDYGLAYYELVTYYQLYHQDQLTQKDIHQRLNAPKQSINNIIKQADQKGHVSLLVNPQNRKEKLISLNQAGRAYAKDFIEPLIAVEEAAAASLSDQEAEALGAILEKYISGFETALGGGRH